MDSRFALVSEEEFVLINKESVLKNPKKKKKFCLTVFCVKLSILPNTLQKQNLSYIVILLYCFIVSFSMLILITITI